MQKELLVSRKIYPLEVIYAAAYVFIDRCYIFLDLGKDDRIAVRLRPRPETAEAQFEEVAGAFENELLNQALRLKISKRTEKVRDAIVHRALFSAMPESIDLSLTEPGPADYLDDPLGIAVPWEEKFGKDKEKKDA